MNTAPLFPKAWNIWKIALMGPARSDAGAQALNQDDLTRVQSWLDRLLDQAWLFGSDVDAVHLLEPVAGRRVLRRREQMSPIPMLPAGEVHTVDVGFWYDGAQQSIPWPVDSSMMVLKVFSPDRVTKPPATWQERAGAVVGPPVAAAKSLVLTVAFAAVLIAGAFWVSKRSMHSASDENQDHTA